MDCLSEHPWNAIMLLSYLLYQIPVFVVWLAGVVLALVRWKRHPKVSLLTIIAFVLFFAEILSPFYLNVWTLQGLSANMELVSTAINIIEPLITAAAWGLLLAAIFGWRSEQ